MSITEAAESTRRRGTAVITGAAGGLGAAFARHLAARGYDLLLVDRREERLTALAADLRRQPAIRADVQVADLSRAADVDRLAARLAADAELTVLINNAGFGTRGAFATADLDRQLAMIDVHVTASVWLTRVVVPGMIDRRRGAIVNLASVAAFVPTSGSVTYDATKAFLIAFSQALHAELRGTGVRVQALCPGFTDTEFHETGDYAGFDKSRIPHWLWMSADDVVVASLRALHRDQPVCVPGRLNQLIVGLARSGVLPPILRRLPRRTRQDR
jgi:hypothetical protein